MENLTNSLQNLEINKSKLMELSSNKYGIIIVLHYNQSFSPCNYSFNSFKMNINMTSILLKNNQLVIFEDNNNYSLQYELTKYKIFETNISKIINKEFKNINLYCVILNSLYIDIDSLYKWTHLYDLFDINIYKYENIYKYLIDSTLTNMNSHILRDIQINYDENNLNHLPQYTIKLYNIYQCLY